ncbi:MAG: CoA transferase [Chloroflexota bacterium]|nr:CoA transferase [Chloroflexota bacterium]
MAADGQSVPETTGPLAGIVVCDLSTVLAGPYCTMMLGDLGANVVKVEPPGGDPTRGYGPPYLGGDAAARAGSPASAGPRGRGESAYYLSVNRNKRGMRVDLKREEGREVVRRLLARSDVLVENNRPGRFARLGFGDDEMSRLNPRLIHLSITGYGPDGPAAERPGFDFIIQATSGLMSITGEPDEAGGEPTKVGVAIADLVTGMQAAVAVLAALAAREREGTPAFGRGQRIEISLFEATLASLVNQAANYLLAGVVPGRMGNRHPSITPYETYHTADGVIALAVGSEAQWKRLCGALEIPDLADDPRFETNADRVEHRGELQVVLEARFAARTTAAWLDRLDAADVPAGPINDLAAAFGDPHADGRRMIEVVAHPTLGELRLAGIPFKLSRTPGSVRRAPPLLGEHTDELLAWLGYTAAQRQALRAVGAV